MDYHILYLNLYNNSKTLLSLNFVVNVVNIVCLYIKIDGKAGVRQDIEQIQENHTYTIVAYGEFSNNSISWGVAQSMDLLY